MHLHRHSAALAIITAGMLVFQWLITRLMPGPEQTELLRQMVGFMPASVRAAIQDELLVTFTPSGFLAFGYVHPVVLVLMGSWVVRVSAGALAGEIGQGTMDLLASRPVRRESLLGAALAVLLLGLALIALAGLTGTMMGLRSRPIEGMHFARFLPVIGGLWLLFAAFGAIGLLISSLRKHGGNAIAWTSGIMALSFALEYVSRAWQPIRFLKPFTLFAYYHPQRSLTSGIDALDVVVLSSVLVVSIALAGAWFRRRDL